MDRNFEGIIIEISSDPQLAGGKAYYTCKVQGRDSSILTMGVGRDQLKGVKVGDATFGYIYNWPPLPQYQGLAKMTGNGRLVIETDYTDAIEAQKLRRKPGFKNFPAPEGIE
jgi:hypothetical protein